MEKNGFAQILSQIAQAKQTNPEEIRRHMEKVMASALQNPDLAVQKMWDSIPRRGTVPTLDEFMEYLIDQNQLVP